MNFRLQQFLSAENISQAQFADAIGVARASVSHILAGRNKPGFDFISNMARAYPEINLEWLISGKGKMYKDGRIRQEESMQVAEAQLFSGQGPVPEVPETRPEDNIPTPTVKVIDKEAEAIRPKVKLQSSGRNISRIVVFYDDGTYQELREA